MKKNKVFDSISPIILVLYLIWMGRFLVLKLNFINEMEKTNILTRIQEENKYGYMNDKEKIVIDPIYDDAATIFHEELGEVKIHNKWGFIDKAGKLVINPIYDSAEWFNEGLAAVKINGKWGFIDKNGDLVIKAIYDDAELFNDGLASVGINDKRGFIHKTGTLVTELYDDVKWFDEGLAPVKTNGKWGFIDKEGTMVIEPKFDYAYSFFNGRANVVIDEKTRMIDKSGKILKFDWIFKILDILYEIINIFI